MTRVLAPLLFGLIGAAILISLGIWQMQRLAWKEGVLAQIDARMQAAPIDIPAKPVFEEHRYTRVKVSGELGGDELHVLTSRKGVGAGYLVISPLAMGDGRRILIDRGFVKAEDKSDERPSGFRSLTGNLNWPDDRGSATPENDVSGNIWFARDVGQMAEVLGTDPIMVIAATSDEPLGTTPLPVDTSGIPNDHLQYAITWFSLAGVWIAMTAFLMFRILRQ